MCLHYSEYMTDKVKEKFKNKEYIRVYRIYKICGNKIYSPYRYAELKVSGLFVLSNRKSLNFSREEKKERYLSRGIHVFHNWKDAVDRCRDGDFVIPVMGFKKDFVASSFCVVYKNAEPVLFQSVFLKIKLYKPMSYYLNKYKGKNG